MLFARRNRRSEGGRIEAIYYPASPCYISPGGRAHFATMSAPKSRGRRIAASWVELTTAANDRISSPSPASNNEGVVRGPARPVTQGATATPSVLVRPAHLWALRLEKKKPCPVRRVCGGGRSLTSPFPLRVAFFRERPQLGRDGVDVPVEQKGEQS